MLSRTAIQTLALGAAGVAAFWLLGLPLPFLFGPMAACLAAALGGFRLASVEPAGKASRTVLGVAVGASLTPELAAQLPSMAASVALVPIYIGLIALIGIPFYSRVCGFDRTTAFFAAMPGGLADMVLFGQQAGANMRALSLVHATRVLIIITVVPVLMVQGFDLTLQGAPGEPVSSVPVHELALMVVAAYAGWKLAERVGLFGAPILGPLIVTGVLALTDLIHHRPPAEAIMAAQYFIGINIGVQYVGVTWRELRFDVLAGSAFAVMLAALAAVFTAIVAGAGIAPPLEAFLAFAPGGQAEMTILAIIAGADLGFVVVHHIARIVLVITGAPIAARLMGVTGRRKG